MRLDFVIHPELRSYYSHSDRASLAPLDRLIINK